MKKIIFLISLFTISIFSPLFGDEKKDSYTKIIYKDKPKKKISDKKKLDRKKKSYWEKSNKIFHRFSRNSIYSDNNPANLAINSPFYNFRIDLPKIDFHFTNKSITPNLIIDYFTKGQRLTSTEQNEVVNSINNLHLLTNLNISPMRIDFGKYRFSSNLHTLVNGDLRGEILSVPFSNLNMGSNFNQKFDFEILSYVKNSLGIGQAFKTDFATIRVGANYNYYLGIAYFKTSADTFNLVNNLEMFSSSMSLSMEGSQLVWDAMGEDGIDSDKFEEEYFAETSNGIDLGVGVNLKKLIHQNLDIELIIENIDAKFTFKNGKKETYSNTIYGSNILEFSDSLNSIGNEMDTISIVKDFTVEIPQKTIINATYQPIPQIVVSGGFEKYSGNFVTHSSKTNIHLKTGYYPTNWFNINYGLRTRNQQVVQSIGTGFQSKIMDLLIDVSSYDGILNNANGLGLSFRLSFYL